MSNVNQIAKIFFDAKSASAVNGRLILQEAVTGKNLRIAFNPKTFNVESILELKNKCWHEAFSIGKTRKQENDLAEEWKATASKYAKAWAEGDGRKTFGRLFG